MKGQKSNSLRVDDEIGNAFIAIADLLNIDRSELLEKVMSSYIESVRGNLSDISTEHPQFAREYPFVEH